MPDIENSRKTAEKGAEWVAANGKTAEKQPEKHPKHPKNTRKTVKTAVFRAFRLFFRLFFGCFSVTRSAPFSAVFNVGHLAPL